MTPTPTPTGPPPSRKPEPLPTTFQPPPSNDTAHNLKFYQEAEHLERASPEDITPQLPNMVTRDAVVYLHPLNYDTNPTATRHRHQVYAHVPQRRPSSGPTFPQSPNVTMPASRGNGILPRPLAASAPVFSLTHKSYPDATVSDLSTA